MYSPRTHHRRGARVVAAVAALSLVAAACGGDDDDDDDAEPAAETTESAAEPTTAETTETTDAEPADVDTTEPATTEPTGGEATGEPVRVMAMGTIESAAFSLPSIPVGAQIAIDEINAAGGVDGRPLELLTCNDEANPNLAVECVQQALDAGVVAFVGGLTLFDVNTVPLTEPEGIPWIGLSAAGLTEAPNLYLVADGPSAFSGAGASIVRNADCTNVGVLYDIASTELQAGWLSAGVEAEGGTVVGVQQGNEGDFAPLIESLLADGAECIVSGVSPAATGPALGAIAGRVPVSTVDGSLPAPLLGALGPAADGVLITAGFEYPGTGNAKVDELAATSAAIDPQVSLDQFWFTGYVGAYLVAEALRGAAEVSGQAVQDGLANVVGFDTGVGPVLDYSQNIGVPGFGSNYNPFVYQLVAENGGYALAESEPYDTTAALTLLVGG